MGKKLDTIADTAPKSQMKHLDVIEGKIKEVGLVSPKAELDVLYSFLNKYRNKDILSDKDLNEASKDVIKALGYHVHRRFLRIGKKAYETIADTKDSNGKSYAELIVYGQYQLTSDIIKQKIKEVTNGGDKLSPQLLLSIIEPHINYQLQRSQDTAIGGVDSDVAYMSSMKKYIGDQLKKHPDLKGKYDTKKMTAPKEVFGAYNNLMQELYGKGNERSYRKRR